jgi:phosphatidylserine decarboxylase
LSAVAARMVIVIKAKNPKIGRIAIVFIGMAEVSSCVATVKIGQLVKKGEQLGYFMFGGSTHAMIFQKKTKLNFKKDGFYFWNPEIQDFDSIKQNLHSYLAHVE